MHDDDIYEQLYDKYIHYRYFNIQITSQRGQTAAYVNFEDTRTAETAYRETIRSICLFDGHVEVTPVVRGQRIQPIKVRGREEIKKRTIPRPQRSGQAHVNDQCRVLFVGNLNPKVEEEDISSVFSKYGHVEAIQFRGNEDGIYCFVTFADMNMAEVAKRNTHGLRFGKYNCLIGYGRPIPSLCIYVGLVPDKDEVYPLFEPFGLIRKDFWPVGADFGYFMYDQISSAVDAFKKMKGYVLPSTGVAIQVDYAKESHMNQSFADLIIKSRSFQKTTPKKSIKSRFSSDLSSSNNIRTEVENDNFINVDEKQTSNRKKFDPPFFNVVDSVGDEGEISYLKYSKKRAFFQENEEDAVEIPPVSPMTPAKGDGDENYSLSYVSDEEGEYFSPLKTMSQIKDSEDVWKGAFMLKSSNIPVSFRFVRGNYQLVDYFLYKHTILTNEMNGKQKEPVLLSIVHRLRLDPDKLGEVQNRIDNSDGAYCVLVAFSSDCSSGQSSLHNLVNYFEEKNAAAVVVISVSYSFGGTEKKSTAALHAFPKCDFSRKLLSPVVSEESFNSFEDDFLTVVIVGTGMGDLPSTILAAPSKSGSSSFEKSIF
ncbi:RNA-binding protein spenito-like [Octopus sinensis]|uniref:RNA-binding protein spenito-like n=1 Tax=Octopus sinensis TaxID=2607531 RepID=A0A6P7U291_9MOLL|nr:RNA-binding protein spenito-like [Octopus sinensis]XP_029656863.1 RNA-binding protein spenito-like [Octopus sinensis]